MLPSFMASKLPGLSYPYPPQPPPQPSPTSAASAAANSPSSNTSSSAPPLDSQLACTSCGHVFGTRRSIMDDTYHVYGKPAYLLTDVELMGCQHSQKEKRSMRSGTYDIEWVSCPCGVALGFVYVRVYDDSFAYKLGKAVMLQDKLALRTPPQNGNSSTANLGNASPSHSSHRQQEIGNVKPAPVVDASTSPTPTVATTQDAEDEGYVFVSTEPDDGVIVMD